MERHHPVEEGFIDLRQKSARHQAAREICRDVDPAAEGLARGGKQRVDTGCARHVGALKSGYLR